MGAAQTRGEGAYRIKINPENFIGEGSYARVYKILRKYDNKVCVAKIFNMSKKLSEPTV
jgi:hypothetical protein